MRAVAQASRWTRPSAARGPEPDCATLVSEQTSGRFSAVVPPSLAASSGPASSTEGLERGESAMAKRSRNSFFLD